jgi:hypothetical protein
MSNTFSDGTLSVVKVLVPKGRGWREIPTNSIPSMGYPIRAFFHDESNLAVLSAVEVMADENKGPEYHLSISKQLIGGAQRCDSNEAKWVLDQFELAGAEEDNHVPSGIVRNFWRTVAEPLIGQECACKDSEPVIREDKGDYIWRPAPDKTDQGKRRNLVHP